MGQLESTFRAILSRLANGLERGVGEREKSRMGCDREAGRNGKVWRVEDWGMFNSESCQL